MKELKTIDLDRHCHPPYDVYFRAYSIAEVNFLERLQYYFRGHTDPQAIIDAWENYGNTKSNGVIPEPNGGDKLLAEILEILKDGPQSSFDIYIDVRDVYYGANHVELALDKLTDDGKVEKIGNEYQLVRAVK